MAILQALSYTPQVPSATPSMKRARIFCATHCLLTAFCVVSLAFTAGCGDTPSPTFASLAPIRAAAAAEAAPDDDVGHGDGYSFRIHFAALQSEWRTLNSAVHDYATTQKKDFIAAQGGERRADAPENQFDLKFYIARRTDDFVSVLAEGSSFTGGAHGNALVASFVYHNQAGKLISIGDLFSDPAAALDVLSTECRNQLKGRLDAQLREQIGEGPKLGPALKDMQDWVERGTEPKPENFSIFLVDGLESRAIGLTLVFPPYQVAPYVDGSQQVEVPARLFHTLLKPEYTGAFLWDTEAEKGQR